MEETQILEYLMERFVQRLRPVLYEIVNEAMAKLSLPQPSKDEDELFTAQQVTAHFDISRATVHNWQKKGVIQSYKIGSKVF